MADGLSPFHRGEKALQSRLGVRDKVEQIGRRMIRDEMSEQHREFFSRLPLLIVSTADGAGRPWVSVLAGNPGFVRAPDARTLEVRATPIHADPLSRGLVPGADIGALGLEFPTRRRNRINGKVRRTETGVFQIQVEQSFGNCPKYIQAREPVVEEPLSAGEEPSVRRGEALEAAQAAMIARCDTFFIASRFAGDGDDGTHGMDVSHRGGRPGFVQVTDRTSLLFPDYPGNCMFNTLGNILVHPGCGLLFIDFESGDTLQITGQAAILWEPEDTRRFPGAERVVAFTLEETLHVERALPVSWTFKGYSPSFDRLGARP